MASVLVLAVTPETCPSRAQRLRDREALLHLRRAERDGERTLAISAEARAVLLTGPLRTRLQEQREALSACRRARADEQAADAAAWHSIEADFQPTEAWEGIR